MSKIDLKDYENFVASTVSEPSRDFESLIFRMDDLVQEDLVQLPQLLTAALGLSAEAGEFTEVVKKILLQGKPLNEENVFHMKRELGDILWYVSMGCAALNTSLEEVLVMNVEKLSARYPEGFNIIKSEIRKEGDV